MICLCVYRFAHAEDAKRAIQELNGKKPPQFEEEIVVKLAHFDIGDSRNRWTNKFGPSGPAASMNGGVGGGGGHFNQNMYQNHFNAPIGSMQGVNTSFANVTHPFSGATPGSTAPSSNVSSTTNPNSFSADSSQANDVNVSVNMNGLNVSNNNNQSNMMQQLQMNNQMQAIQQQMQQWSIANGAASNNPAGIFSNNADMAHEYYYYPRFSYRHDPYPHYVHFEGQSSALNQFSFPAATPVMMPAPTLFNQSMANSNPQPSVPTTSQQQQQQQQQMHCQISNGSHNSTGNGSPQTNHSGGSNDIKWTKKEKVRICMRVSLMFVYTQNRIHVQKLGDQLYQKVLKMTGKVNVP